MMALRRGLLLFLTIVPLFLALTYTNSTHVEIIGTTVIPEFPSIIANMIILIALTLIMIFAKRRLMPNAPSNIK